MKNIAWYGILLLVLVAGCKKDKDETPALNVVGTWRMSETAINKLTYYQFTADGYLYVLRRDSKGWKDMVKGLYQFEDGQLITSFPSSTPGSSITSTLYNITEGVDSLILKRGQNEDDIVLLKDNLAPKKVEDFITPLQVLASFEDTAKCIGITYYNNKLYGTKGTDKLMVYGIAEKRVVDIRTMANYYEGIEFDYNGNLWGVGYSYKFDKLDPVTGNVLFSSVDGNSYYYALTFDGIYWIGYGGSDSRLDKYYYQTDAFTSGYGGNDYIKDLAYGNGYGYATQKGVVHKFSQSFYQYDKAYYIEGYYCRSIAYDQNTDKYWIGAEDMNTGKFYMLQVQLN